MEGDTTYLCVYVFGVSEVKPSGPGVSRKGDETRWDTTVNGFQERDETRRDTTTAGIS